MEDCQGIFTADEDEEGLPPFRRPMKTYPLSEIGIKKRHYDSDEEDLRMYKKQKVLNYLHRFKEKVKIRGKDPRVFEEDLRVYKKKRLLKYRHSFEEEVKIQGKDPQVFEKEQQRRLDMQAWCAQSNWTSNRDVGLARAGLPAEH
jgi:hypothetical protein